MAALLPPSTSLQLSKIRSCAGIPPLQPNGWRRHSRQKQVMIQLKRKESPFKPLCDGRSHGPEEPHHPPQFVPLSLSPLEAVVDDFYTSLNAKDHPRLCELISDDCVFEDLAFSKPFKGKEVHHFLKDLTAAMGKDVKFVIDKVYQGRESSIAVRWHLEWQEKRIPLATGCSFYDCATNGEGLLIKKATVYFESPLKPGDFVLELLKIISSLFDNFPKQAKWFLEKPHAMIQFMIKAYKILIEPFILPLLVYYTHLWTYGARILSFLLSLLLNLLKKFM